MDTALHTALIYGDTLFLKGVADILRSLPSMEVIEKKPEDIESFLTETQPEVVLIDAAQTSFIQMEQLIETFPAQSCPPFVRLNVGEQKLTVHSTQSQPAVTVADLVQVIEKIFDPINRPQSAFRPPCTGTAFCQPLAGCRRRINSHQGCM